MKKDYMTRLESWARWMLPHQEADDVITDYRDIVGTPPRPEEELLRDLGKPRNVIKPLTQKKPYYTWLAVFTLMTICILLPAVSPLPLGPYPIWFTLFLPGGFLIPGVPMFLWFMILGLALSLIWFRPQKGEPKAPLPRPVLIILIVELALTAAVWWLFWQLTLYPDGMFATAALQLPGCFRIAPYTFSSNWVSLLLEWGGAAAGAVGVVGLVKARTQNRRWRAVYVMSMALMLLAFCLLSLFTSMDVSSTEPWACTLQHSIEITAIGLIGAGVSLC